MPRKFTAPAPPSVSVSARETEIVATFLLKNLDEVARYMKARRFAELAVFADYVRMDVPRSIAQTDPALFQVLRKGVTEALIRGYGNMDGNHLRSLAVKDAAKRMKKRR